MLLRLGDPRVRVPAAVDAVALQRLEIAQAGALYALLQLGPLQDEGLELRHVGAGTGVARAFTIANKNGEICLIFDRHSNFNSSKCIFFRVESW